MSKLQTVSINILNSFYELSVFECSGLYDSDEYNLKIDYLLEMIDEERKLYLLKDEVEEYCKERDICKILCKRFRNCLDLLLTFPKNTFNNGKINYSVFDNINNRKKIINSIVALDFELLTFRYFRRIIDFCEDELLKENLIDNFYKDACCSVLSCKELVKNKFVFEDDYVLKGYFYADLMSVDRDYVTDTYEVICKNMFGANVNSLFNDSNINKVDFYKLLSGIKVSVMLMGDSLAEKSYEYLDYQFQLHHSRKDVFDGVKDILDNRANLKFNYRILTYGKKF